jgi:hypothetical protein
MTSVSKTFAVSAATLFASAFLVLTAPTAKAEDYCITNGAQAAHGCGYPTMETCRAAAAAARRPTTRSPSNRSRRSITSFGPARRPTRTDRALRLVVSTFTAFGMPEAVNV